MLQLLEALSFAHERNIAHLDIKVRIVPTKIPIQTNYHSFWLYSSYFNQYFNSIAHIWLENQAKILSVVFYGLGFWNSIYKLFKIFFNPGDSSQILTSMEDS